MGIEVEFRRLSLLCVLPEKIDNAGKLDKEFIHIFTLEVTEDELIAIKHDFEVEELVSIKKKISRIFA